MQFSKFKTKPFSHQIECLNKFGNFQNFALLAEMGTGKSWIIINNIADMWGRGEIDSALIIAPSGVRENWLLNELPAHMPDWCDYVAAGYFAAANKKEKNDFENLFDAYFCKNKMRILVINHEALQNKNGFAASEKFCRSSLNLAIILDESDAFKNPKALRTKNLLKLKKYAKFKRIMSGTPVNNSPFDLFSQFNFLDENILKTNSFYAFKSEYAEMLQDGNPLLNAIKNKSGARFTPQIVARGADGKPKFKNLDKLNALIKPYAFIIKRKDCLDLPPKIYKTLYFDLTAKQLKAYNKAKDECRLILENENETAFNKLNALQKCAQITSGFYLHENQKYLIGGENPKIELLRNLLVEKMHGKKVIIWARFRAEIKMIAELLQTLKLNEKNGVVGCGAAPIPYVEYHGGVALADRVNSVEAFERGFTNIFLANQQAAGVGLTLNAADCAIYFSNDFSLRARLQSEDRCHRIGQNKSVVYFDLCAKNTVDEIVLKALKSKKDIAELIVANNFAL